MATVNKRLRIRLEARPGKKSDIAAVLEQAPQSSQAEPSCR